jgi:hypothetical protein
VYGSHDVVLEINALAHDRSDQQLLGSKLAQVRAAGGGR